MYQVINLNEIILKDKATYRRSQYKCPECNYNLVSGIQVTKDIGYIALCFNCDFKIHSSHLKSYYAKAEQKELS